MSKLIFVVFFWASPPFPGWETVLIFPETREVVSLGPQPHPASPLSALVNLVWTPSGRLAARIIRVSSLPLSRLRHRNFGSQKVAHRQTAASSAAPLKLRPLSLLWGEWRYRLLWFGVISRLISVFLGRLTHYDWWTWEEDSVQLLYLCDFMNRAVVRSHSRRIVTSKRIPLCLEPFHL